VVLCALCIRRCLLWPCQFQISIDMSHASDDQLEWTFWTNFWSWLIPNMTKWKARYAARPIWRFTITNRILKAHEGIFGQMFAHCDHNSAFQDDWLSQRKQISKQGSSGMLSNVNDSDECWLKAEYSACPSPPSRGAPTVP
jgi:hypothetical protein